MKVTQRYGKQPSYFERWKEKRQAVLTSERTTIAGAGYVLLLGDPEAARKLFKVVPDADQN